MAEQAGVGERHDFDSAGTHSYHIGDAPDQRAIVAGAQRGYDLTPLRARRVSMNDFECFDYVLAMDDDNLASLAEICPRQYRHRLMRLLDFATHVDVREVPDPYYGSADGFETVIDLVELGVTGLLSKLK